MIDHLQRLAQRIQSLRLPSAVLGAAGLATLVVAVLILEPDQGDPYIIPGFIGMLWGMSTYSFIVAFRSAPGKNSNPVGVFRKLVHRLHSLLVRVHQRCFPGDHGGRHRGHDPDDFHMAAGVWRLTQAFPEQTKREVSRTRAVSENPLAITGMARFWR